MTLSGQKGQYSWVPAISFSKSGFSHLSSIKWQIRALLPVRGSIRISLGIDLRSMFLAGFKMTVSFFLASNFMNPPFMILSFQ